MRQLIGLVLVATMLACAPATQSVMPVDQPGLATSPAPTTSPAPSASATLAPSESAVARIDHPTGAGDVILRLDYTPDVALGELEGFYFAPGPEFTLFGDRRIILRNRSSDEPQRENGILRAAPFRTAILAEHELQSLLRSALDERGLRSARDRYDVQVDVDAAGATIFEVHAGGIDRRVEVIGSAIAPLEDLETELLEFAEERGDTQLWLPDRYWGVLFDVDPEQRAIGLLPTYAESPPYAWPWPDISPDDFARRPIDPDYAYPRHAFTPDEAAVLGLADGGGVVQLVYLRTPDDAIYGFALWPMLPDEAP